MNNSVFIEIRKRTEDFFRLSHHDKFHRDRVYNVAVRIAKAENADLDVVMTAALLHDIARAMEDEGKITDHAIEGAKIASKILEQVGFPEKKTSNVIHCIETHRFRKGVKATSLEAMILQDADRLDILGAIGLARVFTRGGWSNKPIHNPEIPPKRRYDGKSLTSINHIYEKILKVKDTINTTAAREIAERRHRFVEQFLKRFLNEWKAEI